jgi:hypothetical protein
MNHHYYTSYENQSKYLTLTFISRSHLGKKLKNIAKSLKLFFSQTPSARDVQKPIS